MRAFVVKELSHPSKISLTTDAPEPIPTADQVIVEVYSAGLNFYDILQAQGKYQVRPPLPFTLGSEFSGKIAANSPIPEGCKFKRGDRIFGAMQGAYADRIVVNWTQLLPLPNNLTFDQGAGLYITWPTCYEALVGRAQIQAGEWLMVTASAGGVGMASLQIAKALGAKVIAAAGSAEKLEVAKKYGGADYAVDYTKPGWQKEVLRITDGKGVNVICDPVGLIKDSLSCISWKGRAIVIGFAGGHIEKLPLNLVLLKNVSIVGIHWGAYKIHEPTHISSVWKGIFEILSRGKVTPVIFPDVVPLERLGDGLTALENRKTWGKVIVKVKEDIPFTRL